MVLMADSEQSPDTWPRDHNRGGSQPGGVRRHDSRRHSILVGSGQDGGRPTTVTAAAVQILTSSSHEREADL